MHANFFLNDRFPNNIAMIRDDFDKDHIVWVTAIEPPYGSEPGVIHGKAFYRKSATWEFEMTSLQADGTRKKSGDLSSAKMYSFIVKQPRAHRQKWNVERIIGKCVALPVVPNFPTNTDEDPALDLSMVVTLLHHCVPE